MKRLFKWLLILILVCGALVVAGGWYVRANAAPADSFRTVPVTRGNLLATIGATGTLEPEEVVDVGAQVAGKIEYFGKDSTDPNKTIDYGSKVEENQILAHIDTTLYDSDVDSANAQLEEAKASAAKSEADLNRLKANLNLAERDWNRAQELGPSSALAQTQYDSYQAAYLVAKANVAVGEATVIQAQKSVGSAEVSLRKAQRNLGYCTIKSPVKGTIIDRRVNIGQTVVSSLNAPSLFLIAKDLNRMQVWASVNEADIGNIHPGMAVLFSVDAYPGQSFQGSVNKVRLNATMTQNVVTYTVEIVTDNSDGRLLPYLTATVNFQLDQRNGVLMVPNAALRWSPQPGQIAPDAQADAPTSAPSSQPAGEGRRGRGGRGRRGGGGSGGGGGGEFHERGTLWVSDGQYVRPISVRVGLTDGTSTEVQANELAENTQVVISDAPIVDSSSAGGRNPFLPQFGGRGGRRGLGR